MSGLKKLAAETIGKQIDHTIKSVGEEVLEGAGKISHKKAMEKAEVEYRKY